MDAERTLIQATVVGVNDSSVLYPACKQCCAKMLHNLQHDMWTCLRCNITCCKSQLAWRYRLSLSIADSSASCQVSLFGGILGQYFGCSAGEFHRFVSSTYLRGQPLESHSNLLMQALESVLVGNIYLFGLKLPKPPATKRVQKQDFLPKCGSVITLADLLARHASGSAVAGKMSDFIGVQMIQTAASAKSQTGHLTVVDALKHCYLQSDSSSSQQSKVSDSANEGVIINTTSPNARSSQMSGGCIGAKCIRSNIHRMSLTQNNQISNERSSQTAVGREGNSAVSSASLLGGACTSSFCDNSSRSQSQGLCSASATPMFSCDSSMERDFCSSQLSVHASQSETTEMLRHAEDVNKHRKSSQGERRHLSQCFFSESSPNFEECAQGMMSASNSIAQCDTNFDPECVPCDGMTNSTHLSSCSHNTVPEFYPLMLTPPSAQLRGGQCEHKRVNSSDHSFDETLEPDTFTPEHNGRSGRGSHSRETLEVPMLNPQCMPQVGSKQLKLQLKSLEGGSFFQLSCEHFRCEKKSQALSLGIDEDMTHDAAFSSSLNDSSLLLAVVQHEPESTESEKIHSERSQCLQEPVSVFGRRWSASLERTELLEAEDKALKLSVSVPGHELDCHHANSNSLSNHHHAVGSICDNHLSWDESFNIDQNFDLASNLSVHPAGGGSKCDAADFNTHMPDSEDLSLFLAGVASKNSGTHSYAGKLSTVSTVNKPTTDSSVKTTEKPNSCSPSMPSAQLSDPLTDPAVRSRTQLNLFSCTASSTQMRGGRCATKWVSRVSPVGPSKLNQLCIPPADTGARRKKQLNPVSPTVPSTHLSEGQSRAKVVKTSCLHKSSTDSEVFVEDGTLSPTMLDQAFTSWCASPSSTSTSHANLHIAYGQQLQQTVDLPDSEDLFGFLDKVSGESSENTIAVQGTISFPVGNVKKSDTVPSINIDSVALNQAEEHAEKKDSIHFCTIATPLYSGLGRHGTTWVKESENSLPQHVLDTAKDTVESVCNTDNMNVPAIGTSPKSSEPGSANSSLLDGSAVLFFSQTSPCQSSSSAAVNSIMLLQGSDKSRVISESTFETSENKPEQNSEELKEKLFQDLSTSSTLSKSEISSSLDTWPSETTACKNEKKRSHGKRRVRFSGRRSTVSSVDAIDCRLDKFSSLAATESQKHLQSAPLKSCLQSKRSQHVSRSACPSVSAKGFLSLSQTPRGRHSEVKNGKKISPKALTPIISLESNTMSDTNITSSNFTLLRVDPKTPDTEVRSTPDCPPPGAEAHFLHQSPHPLQTSGSQDLFSPCADHSLMIMASQSPVSVLSHQTVYKMLSSSAKGTETSSSECTNSNTEGTETTTTKSSKCKRPSPVSLNSCPLSKPNISKECHPQEKFDGLNERHSGAVIECDEAPVLKDLNHTRMRRKITENFDNSGSFVTVRKMRRSTHFTDTGVEGNSSEKQSLLMSPFTGYLPESAAAESSPNSTSTDLFDSSAALFDDEDEEKENNCSGCDVHREVGPKDKAGCTEKHETQSQKIEVYHDGEVFSTPKQTVVHVPYLIGADSPALFESPDLFS